MRVRGTIRVKLVAGIFAIFVCAFLVINYYSYRQISLNNENIITEELSSLRGTSTLYVRQAFVINNRNNSPEDFRQSAEEIVAELKGVSGIPVEAYTPEGAAIQSQRRQIDLQSPEMRDLLYAVQDKQAMTITPTENDGVMVYYSFPVVIEGNKVGILRFSKDYTTLYEQGYQISEAILLVTVCVFLAALVLASLLASNLAKPIVRLTRATNKVTSWLTQDHEFDRAELEKSINTRRRDEVGELSRNFYTMVTRIDQQIEIIRQDRDSIQELYEHKKIFMDNVTHELKTPLTAILGYAELIRDNGYSDPVFFDKAVQHIIHESQRLHNMVVRLLEMSRSASTAQELQGRVDIGKLLADVCETMRFKAQRYEGKIQCRTETGLIVRGSAERLKEVMINILDNAIKYGQPGTEIQAAAFYLEAEDAVVFATRNWGKGMTEREIERIFDPFYRADKEHSREMGSSGLGMSISKQIVDEHGGRIAVQSSPGETTVVSVMLPRLHQSGKEAGEK